ncbi:hypothetical protein Ocin01_18462 [Orchesella cincta]|uniref:BTB domain-containing protein n=1 Tax=Orchesella cincta TaxID=48709 RepID=A0A1D2M5N1_ORCCI|nr:hypothetical protein Ocin01_18462 [Orchesella cincta]
MNLFLLENYSTRLQLRRACTNTANGTASVFLFDQEMSPNGKGKLKEGRFPWKVYQVPESPGVFGFKLHISFVVTKSITDTEGKSTPAILETEVGEMRAFLQEDGAIKFLASGNIDASAAEIMYFSATGGYRNPTDILTLTMELVNQTSMTPSLSATPNALQELMRASSRKKSNLILFSSLKTEAHCPAFENMFKTNTNLVQQSRHQLSLSEEGLKALLDFVYCLKLDIPKEKPGVALALLEIGIKMQMPMLTKAMNNLLVEQPDDWLKFDAALQLLLHSTKMRGYEELKNKAIRAMKL